MFAEWPAKPALLFVYTDESGVTCTTQVDRNAVLDRKQRRIMRALMDEAHHLADERDTIDRRGAEVNRNVR